MEYKTNECNVLFLLPIGSDWELLLCFPINANRLVLTLSQSPGPRHSGGQPFVSVVPVTLAESKGDLLCVA